MRLARFVLICAGASLVGCSGASALREQAEAHLPTRGPVAEASRDEAEATRLGAAAVPSERQLPVPLPIDACLSWALAHNRELRSLINAAERSRLDVTVAHSATYAPRLTASAQRTLTSDVAGSKRLDDATAKVALNTNLLGFTVAPYVASTWSEVQGIEADTPYSSAAGIAISRRIFALAEGTRLSQQLSGADRAYAQSVNSLTLGTRRISLDTARAFFELQRAESRIRLRESRLQQTRDFLAGVREAVAAGLKAPIEETNAAIDTNQAEANLLSDQQSLANARDLLLSRLDRPLGGSVTITPSDVTGVRPDLPPIEQDIARVQAAHETLVNLRIDQDQARDDTGIARDRIVPQVTATASAARTWESDRMAGGDEPADLVALRVEVDLPLDAWTGERASLRKQLRSERDLRLRLRTQEVELERQVRQVRRRIDNQARSVDLAQQRLVAERVKFAATEASYRTGRVDNLELTRAREALDRAEVDLVEARIDLVLNLAEREALMPPEETR
jgi:outer membrane protein TolC